jgi:hypothetical protein
MLQYQSDPFQADMMHAVLQEVDVPIVSHEQCQQQLQHTRLGYEYRLHPGMICAGGEEGKDACKVNIWTHPLLSNLFPLHTAKLLVQFQKTPCGFTVDKGAVE